MGAFFRFLVDAKRMGKFEALWRIGYLEWVSFFLSLLWIFCENLLEWSGKERKGKGGGKWEEKMIRMKERHLGSLCRPFRNILHSIYSHSISRLKHTRIDSSIPYILALYFSHTHHLIVSILDCVPESG